MQELRLNILVAYPYMDKGVISLLNKEKDSIRFLLDSGAFTAWKAGKPIALDDYCRFIESLPFKPWRYFTLDVIGDPEASFKNYEKMLSRGFTPVPIFTRGEDVAMIDEYYKTSDVLGIGGLVGTKGNKGFVRGIMDQIGDRKVHWLGFTNKQFVKYYKPYMCDSSSWEAVARFGGLELYMGGGVFFKCTRVGFKKKPDSHILSTIRSYGLDPKKFAKDEAWWGGPSLSRTLGARSTIRYAMDLESRFNVKQFAAATVVPSINLLIEGYKYEVNRSA